MTMNDAERIDEYFGQVQNTIKHLNGNSVAQVAERLKLARKRGKTVFTMGNGGSAATASHFANDLMKACKLRAISIPDMIPTMTAYGNDHSWTEMFWKPFEGMSKDGDVLFAISGSGESDNIIAALRLAEANKPRCERILLTGREKSHSSELAQYTVFVPHLDIRIQEDGHMIVCHAIVGALKEN